MSSELMTQQEIDDLLATMIDKTAINEPSFARVEKLICLYCKQIIKLGFESATSPPCPQIFASNSMHKKSKCRGNSAGHMFVSKEWLESKKAKTA